MSAESSTLAWLPVLGGLALKSLIVFAVAGASLLALRRASASARHLVCLLTLAALLALPILSLALPGWRVAVLSVPAASREPAVDRTHPASETHPAAGGVGPPGAGGRRASERESDMDVRSFPESPPLTGEGGEPQRAGRGSLPRPFPWAVALTALWLGGVLLALLRPLLGLWGIARLSQGSAPVSDAPTLALASECASALGLSRMPILCQADAPVPMTWGWRRPVVLLPAEAPGWPADRLRAVLLHELAHVRRRDWLSHRFADLVCALYWFHPLVWPVARRLRAEGEIACDDLVLTSGVAAPDYARHLLDVARALRPISDAVPQAAIAMARTARLEGRLKMILDTTRPRRALSRRVLLLALTPGAAALVTLAMLRPSAKAQAAPAPVFGGAPPIGGAASARSVPGVSSAATIPTAPPVALDRARPGSEPVTAAPPMGGAPPKTGVRVALPPPVLDPVLDPVPGPPVRRPSPQPAALGPVAPKTPLALSIMDLKIDGAPTLAGVTDGDKSDSPWWSTAGTLLPTPVYDRGTYHANNNTVPKPQERHLLFAFRLPAQCKDVTVRYEVPQSSWYTSDGSWPTKTYNNDRRSEASLWSSTGGTRILQAGFPASLPKADIRVEIASGPWKVAAIYAPVSGGFGKISALKGNRRFLFSPVSETETGTTLSIAMDAAGEAGAAAADIRVIAIDAQGHELLPESIGDNSAEALDQITARFGTSLDYTLPVPQFTNTSPKLEAGLPVSSPASNPVRITEFRIETRPFRYIEFKNVALQPAP